jgi:hypothetical protein
MDKKKLELGLWIVIFLSIVPVLIFCYEGVYHVNIYLHKNDYMIGVFRVDSFVCGSTFNSFTNCYGYGKINNKIKSKVDLGKSPDVNCISCEYADLNKKEYSVFYRENGKQTVVIRGEHQTMFNANPYLKKGIFELLYPIVIFPVIIFLYRKLKKQNIW